MKIGLINIEPKIVNTAYMQIAAYHKKRGDTVKWWTPLEDRLFDHVYCSSLFDFTDKREIPARAITGGIGYNISSRLSQLIEACDYDYSLYPDCDYSIVWFSRGCIRKCPFCCVWQKEGNIRPTEPKKLNKNGKYIIVQDNNFFANPSWERAIRQLHKWGQPVDFQGIDIRDITIYRCLQLRTLRHYKQIKFAWDNPREDLKLKIKEIIRYIKPSKLACYVLIGYWSTEQEDLYRVETLRSLGIDPFVMPYNKKDSYQKNFTRWVNHKAIFKSVLWKDYNKDAVNKKRAGEI